MTDASSETALITVTVLDVQAVQKGQVIALAAVEIELDGVAFIINGLQVIRTKEPSQQPRGYGRGPAALPRTGWEWKPAIKLPDELREPITAAILEQCCDRGIVSEVPTENVHFGGDGG
jgi:hypothetical protein